MPSGFLIYVKNWPQCLPALRSADPPPPMQTQRFMARRSRPSWHHVMPLLTSRLWRRVTEKGKFMQRRLQSTQRTRSPWLLSPATLSGCVTLLCLCLSQRWKVAEAGHVSFHKANKAVLWWMYRRQKSSKPVRPSRKPYHISTIALGLHSLICLNPAFLRALVPFQQRQFVHSTWANVGNFFQSQTCNSAAVEWIQSVFLPQTDK